MADGDRNAYGQRAHQPAWEPTDPGPAPDPKKHPRYQKAQFGGRSLEWRYEPCTRLRRAGWGGAHTSDQLAQVPCDAHRRYDENGDDEYHRDDRDAANPVGRMESRDPDDGKKCHHTGQMYLGNDR